MQNNNVVIPSNPGRLINAIIDTKETVTVSRAALAKAIAEHKIAKVKAASAIAQLDAAEVRLDKALADLEAAKTLAELSPDELIAVANASRIALDNANQALADKIAELEAAQPARIAEANDGLAFAQNRLNERTAELTALRDQNIANASTELELATAAHAASLQEA